MIALYNNMLNMEPQSGQYWINILLLNKESYEYINELTKCDIISDKTQFIIMEEKC